MLKKLLNKINIILKHIVLENLKDQLRVHVAVSVILESNHPLLHNILNYYITIMFSVSTILLSLLDFVSLGLV